MRMRLVVPAVAVLCLAVASASLQAGKRPPPSPTPQSIAFQAATGGGASDTWQIFRMWTDGTGVQQLTFGAGVWSFEPDWSPDGTQIAFSSAREGKREGIFVMNPDGSGQTRLTDGGICVDCSPRWSPGGDKIAFSRVYGGALDVDGIWTLDLGSGDLTRVTASWDPVSGQELYDQGPSWSADGQFLVFYSPRRTPVGLYTVPADGSGTPTFLASGDQPDWSPSGDRIAYYSGGYIWYVPVGQNDDGAWVTTDSPVQVTSTCDWYTFGPGWSPDGLALTCHLGVYNKKGQCTAQHIATIDLTTTPFTVTDLGIRGLYPDWSPTLGQ